MANPDELMLRSIVTDPEVRDRALRFLALALERGPLWLGLDVRLARGIARFERLQIAFAFARLNGVPEEQVESAQAMLVRAEVDALVDHFEGLGESIREHRDKRGLDALMHHIVRVFAASMEEEDIVFAASGLCRTCAFSLEDAIREAAHEPDAPQRMLDAYRATVNSLTRFSLGEKLPEEWTGLALLWVTALMGLGDLDSDSETTEQY